MICKRCVLDDGLHGDVVLDAGGVCNYCRSYDRIRDEVHDLPRLEVPGQRLFLSWIETSHVRGASHGPEMSRFRT